MTARTSARWAVPFLALLVAVGCTATDDAGDDPTSTDPPATAAIATLCVVVPDRDASSVLAVPERPDLAGDEETIRGLLEIAASGYETSAPSELEAQVDTLAAALRGWEPGAEPLGDDPTTREAVTAIDDWLRVNCPAPPATTP